MKRYIPLLSALLLSACASFSGSGLKPQQDSLADVLRVMGEPSMRWQDPDGAQQLAYPRDSGAESFMVFIGSNGKLKSIDKVLNTEHFALIKEGMSKEQVLRILGPSIKDETVYYERRDELAWTWYFKDYDDIARFHVMFDATKETVRKTGVTPFRVIVGGGER